MKIQYIGKKAGIHVRFPWMKKDVMMVPFKEVDIDNDDGLKLINDFPETFQEWKPDPLQEFIKANTPAAADDAAGKAGGADEIEFEVQDGKYLCPFCEKSYAATDVGKGWLLKHLEKDHAEVWAAALAEKKAEASAGNDAG
jgi:hypothetical protein